MQRRLREEGAGEFLFLRRRRAAEHEAAGQRDLFVIGSRLCWLAIGRGARCGADTCGADNPVGWQAGRRWRDGAEQAAPPLPRIPDEPCRQIVGTTFPAPRSRSHSYLKCTDGHRGWKAPATEGRAPALRRRCGCGRSPACRRVRRRWGASRRCRARRAAGG